MPTFTTRVELHQGSYQDYENLHAAMENAGFSRHVTSDGGRTYHLPTAEYDRSGDLTRSQVFNQAKTAAATTGKDYAVLVTELNGRTWSGLKKVEGRQY
jgi:hypothetical protein